MFLFFNQANALLLASYSTGSVTIENKVVTANKIIPINNKDGKVLIINIPPINTHCTNEDEICTIGTILERIVNQLYA